MTVMPEQPFVTGESRLTIARPIIGPPLITLPASPGRPPGGLDQRRDRRTHAGQQVLRLLHALARDGHHALDQRLVLQHGLIDGNGRRGVAHHGAHVDRQRGRRRHLTARDGCDQLLLTALRVHHLQGHHLDALVSVRRSSSDARWRRVCCSRCRYRLSPTPTAFIRIVTPTTSSSPCSSIVRWSDVR